MKNSAILSIALTTMFLSHSIVTTAEEPVNNLKIVESSQTEAPILEFANTGYDRTTPGYVGRTYVLQQPSGAPAPLGEFSYQWSIEGGDRSYIWPRADGRSADASVYFSGSGTARVICDIYKNGQLVDAITDYIPLY